MSTYYFRSKEDIKFKVKLDNLLKGFKKDIDNFVYLNEEYSEIEDIEDKLRNITNEYRWDIDNDMAIVSTSSKGIRFEWLEGTRRDMIKLEKMSKSGKYQLINEYNEVFSWEEFIREIGYSSDLENK